jgi:hypothetical protein
MTGVDRVELAYLRAFSAGTEPFWMLLRTPYGYLALPADAAGVLSGWLSGDVSLPRRALVDRLRARTGGQSQGEAGLRRMAVARCTRGGLGRMVGRLMPGGGRYFNVGHSDLSDAAMAQLSDVPGLTVTVLVHDTIPLDHPEFNAPGAGAAFEARLRSVARYADRIIATSCVGAGDIARWCTAFGRQPEVVVAPLGVDVPVPASVSVLPEIGKNRPYFLCLGTIEPRKNHGLLLDIWDRLQQEMSPDRLPRLVIAGRRGWAAPQMFTRLDRLTVGGAVVEMNDLSDSDVATLLSGAAALVMPSRAEGFGLPVAEAAALGTPVLCSDLPVYREIVGEYPVYLNPDDLYSWAARIKLRADEARAATGKRDGHGTMPALPTWTEHFNLVLSQSHYGRSGQKTLPQAKGQE